MTRIGLYPGTFDPVTFGHLDIIERAARLVDRLIVAVAVHTAKTPIFDTDERCALVRGEVANLGGGAVAVETFDGLLVDFARQTGADVIFRGIRGAADFDYEFQMAGTNRELAPGVETVFLMASPARQHISATFVRQVAQLGGDIAPFVPASVVAAVENRGKGAGK